MRISNRLLSLLLFGDTAMLRFFFALTSVGWGVWVLSDPTFAAQHAMTIAFVPLPQLGILFITHACAVFYGIWTHRYNVILLFIEGLLGVFLWVGVGLAEAKGQGALGPTLFGGIAAMFLLIRYPTHYTKGRNADS